MTSSEPIEPLFDSTRNALRFALDYHLALPRPLLNKMMDDGKVHWIELADGSKIAFAAPKSTRKAGKRRSEQLNGLDGAATAGIILSHLARQPDAEQFALIAHTATAMLPCACRRPCCMGYAPNPTWLRSINGLCDWLRDEAKQSTLFPRKKGMSTRPEMRQAIVRRFFLPDARLVIAEIARALNVSEPTVYAHQKTITASLEDLLDKGWGRFAEAMDRAQIVGAPT
jgi:hypothetical protein